MQANEKARKLLTRGLSAMRAGAHQAAIARFDKALKLQPPDTDLVVEITRLRKNARQFAGLEIISPVDLHMRVQANREQGYAALENEAYEQAISYLALVLKDNPADEEAREWFDQARQKYGKSDTFVKRIIPLTGTWWSTRTIIGASIVVVLGVLLFIGWTFNPLNTFSSENPPAHTATPSLDPTATRQPGTATPTAQDTGDAFEATNTPRPTSTIETPTASPTLVTVSPTPSATVAPSPTSTALPVGIVTSAGRLNVREEPGTDAPLLDFQLANGEQVEIITSDRGDGCDAADNVWFQVRVLTGEEGWICSQYLQLSD